VIAVILGTFAGVLALLVAAMWVGINTPEPAGHHHKPAKGRFEEARNWVAFKAGREVRMITRRQAERDRDEAWVDEARDIHAGQHMDTMPAPAPEWPLKPLPPGAEEYADHFHRPLDEGTVHMYQLADGQIVPAEGYVPPEDLHEVIRAGIGEAERGETVTHEDPLDVATPEQVADELVGDLPEPEPDHECAQCGKACMKRWSWYPYCSSACIQRAAAGSPSPAPEPESAPLTDYGPSTGSWEAIRDDVLAGGE
jgi:predicted transcriptional regulator